MSYIRRDILKTGLALSAGSLIKTSASALTSSGAAGKVHLGTGSAEPYQPTWNSLRKMIAEGLTVETTKTKPCEHAFVFKIVRKRPY